LSDAEAGQRWPASALWDAALALYARPGAAAACLELQDEHDADVLLLLLGCWLGQRGAVLDDDAAMRCRAVAAEWRASIRPVRAVRRRLKDRLPELRAPLRQPVAALRLQIREAELGLERAALLSLEAELADRRETGAPGPCAASKAIGSLSELDAGAMPALRALLRAVFPEAPALEIERATKPPQGLERPRS
jgi:uncharacterized protein (TIGR02444 family)